MNNDVWVFVGCLERLNAHWPLHMIIISTVSYFNFIIFLSDGFADSETKKMDLFETLHRKIDQKQVPMHNSQLNKNTINNS
jgi:hypothetical protein